MISDASLIRLSDRWDDAVHSVLFLNRLQVMLRPGAKILDFGCGAGTTVFRLRELGFDAYGFDIHDYVAYRSEADRQWFRFSRSTSTDSSAFTIDADSYRVPFPDDWFDVVHSTSVLEHVLDVGSMLGECGRVLTRDGIAVHFYPGRYQLVEPHLYVPLGSFVTSKAWLRLWIALGARNEFQEGRSDSQVAEAYRQYVATGLCYRSRSELRATASLYFDRVRFPPKDVIWPSATPATRFKQLVRAFEGPNVYQKLALCGRLSAMVCERKRRHTSDHLRSVLWKR